MGTQTGWQPDWGWGELNLTDALALRTNFGAEAVPSYGARFYRATTTSAGERATLVWNRRGTACLQAGCQAQMLTLTNLDLQEFDVNTGVLQAQSTSGLDNVEQVRSLGAGQVVYKVKAVSNVDGIPAEPFALAATSPVIPVATPEPTVSLQVSNTRLRPGQTATVTATARNPSGDLTGEGAEIALSVPSGLQIVSGERTQSLGTLATSGTPGDAATATWTVKATGDAADQLIATGSASRYGETFSTPAKSQVIVDGTAPTPTVAMSSGATSGTTIPVSWGASDAGSGVSHFDVEVSRDGQAFTTWLSATTQRNATYVGLPGSRYRFRVRAVDGMGNVSEYVASSEISLLSPATTPPTGDSSAPPNPDSRVVTSPGLRLTAAKRKGKVLTVRGVIARLLDSSLSISYTAKVGHRTYTARRVAHAFGGRFSTTLRIPRPALRARRGLLVIRYSGGEQFRAQNLRVAVRI